MADIPYIEERKRLVELRKQEDELEREEEKAAAPDPKPKSQRGSFSRLCDGSVSRAFQVLEASHVF